MFVDGETISLMPRVVFKHIDDVTSDIFEQYGLPRLGGASGRGWSSFSTLQRCPYLYKVSYIDRFRGPPGKALETGSVMHTMLALHYSWMMDDNWKLSPEVMKEALLDGGARPEAVLEGWRLYSAYALNYEQDYLEPVEQEAWAQDPDGNTCRYDLIARVVEGVVGIPAGLYNVEHKSAARFTADALEGWRNDGEVIGQMMIWKRAGLDDKYGELKGTIVNIIGKQKVPQFHRTVIPVEAWHIEQHTQDLKIWTALQNMYAAMGVWPKARANCTNKFGVCNLFDWCSTNQDHRRPIEELIQIQTNRYKALPETLQNTIIDPTFDEESNK